MNYLRGAVNAISAPYQYYKELPPINPATLTGAIDVIVIQRPSSNGSTELACSPFHVRFGKWQVLRPGEKKVTVSVNGRVIPFDMKIGEAGEAFFVFETEEDVPDELITSPLLTPKSESGGTDAQVDRFGARKDEDSQVEPDFLDLDAQAPKPEEHSNSLPSPPPSPPNAQHEHDNEKTEVEKEQDERADAALKRKTGKSVHVPHVNYHDGVAIDTEGYHSQSFHKHSRSHESHYEEYHHDRDASDRTIRGSSGSGSAQGTYAFPTFEEESDPTPLLSQAQYRATSEPPPNIEVSDTASYPLTPSASTPTNIPDADSTPVVPSATPKSRNKLLPGTKLTLPPQEFTWEWGGFPTPSPMKASFNFGGRPAHQHKHNNTLSWGRGGTIDIGGDFPSSSNSKGKGRLEDVFGTTTLDPVSEAEVVDDEEPESDGDDDDDDDDKVPVTGGMGGRSQSVPPGLEGSPTSARTRRRSLSPGRKRCAAPAKDGKQKGKGKGRRRASESDTMETATGYGAGGLLAVSGSDPTKFRVFIEGKKMEFELSLVERRYANLGEAEGKQGEEEERGRTGKRNTKPALTLRVFSPDGRWTGIDEFEMATLFEQGKVNLQRFLEDESVVKDPRLVIRWTGEQYISRRDSSPLMSALVLWRDSYLKAREAGQVITRPSSPLSDYEEPFTPTSTTASTTTLPTSVEGDDKKENKIERSQSEPPETMEQKEKPQPPTSSSWVQWWSRSRKKTNPSEAKRPELKEAYSEPTVPAPAVINDSSSDVAAQASESAPALPSTPIQQPLSKPKYVKTLRLTSDQLKSLNLKPGPNTITFSLSTTGVVACTARIFVWDSTDLVVISDIDGTITKSDGLGHVFAMIGRDWTHLGVAKLYTDICRNGYKILYLTSRAIGQADATRGYLKGIKQNDYQLPEGPVIMSPDRLIASLHREVIMRKPEVFKMACLRDIQRLFGEASRNTFYAGFGNRITDALSYRSVNVPSSRIFTIDTTGEVKCELLELAGYKSSYIHMTDLVDQMFPPINRKWAPEFTDFNYWKMPVQEFPLPDLSPPSPSLSARSDTSALARLRNFSLVGSRQANNLPPPATAANGADTKDKDTGDYRDSQLRQISSFERLRDTLGFSSSRSASPERSSSPSTMWESESEDDEEGDGSDRRRRERRRSMTSMPGSLDDMEMDFGGDEEGEEGEYDEEMEAQDEENIIDEEAEAFAEDLLAAGEMKNVPFL
ncbi:nuclear elongation and deformation protein 1 [Moniliophthora roreri MCA 2997]|uniref:phosphatidate phosphatase n=1 Tax=Moniliophthora roreri (strain MCA 2997) TaxID=1381753 RepID=V2XRJ3_MONRO|nr:nuclear elongation and deformation protein 1 [Moniliophthora roreri MCA 2997]